MNLRRFLPFILSLMMLTACYRQASDEFTQVNSQNVQSIASPTEALSPLPAETDLDVQSADETSQPANPTKTPDASDLTLSTIVPLASSTIGIPPTSDSPLVPTATEPHIITPEPPPAQVVQPTVIPLTATPTFAIVPPTPTSLADAVIVGDECVYEIVSGDNLFRIAINNGTTVEALKSFNNLTTDNIQPGELLKIPGCVAGASSSSTGSSTQTAPRLTVTSSVGGSSVATVEPAEGLPTGGEKIHVVVSGETLGAIASRYGLSIEALAAANNITDVNSLSIGQELVIPAGS